MKLTAPSAFFKKVFGADRADEINDDITRWDNERACAVDTNDLKKGELEKILAAAKKQPAPDAKLIRKIEGFVKFAANPTGEPVVRLERLEMALRKFIGESKHKYVFYEEDDGYMVPFFVEEIEYHEPTKEAAAKVEMSLKAQHHEEEESKSIYWHSHDLHGHKKVNDLLTEKKLYLETPEALEKWMAELVVFSDILRHTGKQYSAYGQAFGSGRWGGISAMERDGLPSRVVMDYFGDTVDEEGDRVSPTALKTEVADSSFWDEESDGESSVAVPVHPYVQVFDFASHDHCLIHVSNLKPYEYKKGLGDKLVLPTDVKELIEVLMESAESVMEDIIAGKTGGVVVAATGAPGVGKTLTAEVYAEQVQRPLYTVQCSQLGTDENELEKKLTLVLTRASRWGAILLIDEADVYVRARGDDIQQNAIVGVFLRLLEYYRGILFLTSNRETEIDDAIMSRCLAHVKYELPDADALAKIWAILAANYKVGLKQTEITKLVKEFPNISGRNVKNLLKLASTMAKKNNGEVTVEIIKKIAKFISLAK